jgi:phosphoribosylaminoimidazolecarboxamide formyltransferase/IMP cyclohydrolase
MVLRAEVKIFNDLEETSKESKGETLAFETMWELQYGANKQQNAYLLKTDDMADFEILNGSSLTYNEIISINELSNILSEFYDVCAVAIVDHAAPCAVALAPTIEEAYNKAFDSDPMASFYGAFGFTQCVKYSLAEHLCSMSIRLVIAPDYDDKALKILLENPNIKVVKLNTPLENFKNLTQKEIHVTPFGTLMQDFNRSNLGKNSFNVVTKLKPTKEQIEDAVFAWKVSKYTRSNSVVIAKDFKTVAIAQGFVSPITVVESALDTACDGAKNAIMASDNILTSTECIYAAAQNRISMIIQPGGSDKDKKLIELADKYNIAMVFTDMTNYKR